jgi:hypothetical protein
LNADSATSKCLSSRWAALGACGGRFVSPQHHFRHAAIAIGVGVIGIELYRAREGRDRRFSQLQTQQSIAQISLGRRKVGFPCDCFLQAGAGFVVAFEVEQRKTKVAMSIRRARVEGNRAREDLRRLLESPAFEHGHAQQMHGVKVVRHVLEHMPAKRLNIRMPALTIGGERSQQNLSLFPEFLQAQALEGAGADGALQGLFSGRESVARF